MSPQKQKVKYRFENNVLIFHISLSNNKEFIIQFFDDTKSVDYIEVPLMLNCFRLGAIVYNILPKIRTGSNLAITDYLNNTHHHCIRLLGRVI